MQRLKIDPTDSSFSVELDHEKGEFKFSGESRPENAPSFFDPIIVWISEFKKYIEQKNQIFELKTIFKLDYFNSTSTKYIVDILKELKNIEELPNVNLRTEWHYKEIDEDIEESGKELKDWTGLNIDLILDE